MNLVLDDVKETMRGKFPSHEAQAQASSFHYLHQLNSYTNHHPDDEGNKTTRSLGLIVARGTLIVLISPADGSDEIPNPFLQAEE
jgi:U6 snRNA-associated Sm-like protein LSm7